MTEKRRFPIVGLALLLAVAATTLLLLAMDRAAPVHAAFSWRARLAPVRSARTTTAATIRCVEPNGTGCTAPCNVCYGSPQAAEDDANAGDEIRIALGTYTNTGTHVFYVDRSVTIRGGYTTTNWTTPDPVANPTTLDGEGQRRVVYVGGSVTVTLEGLRMTRGMITTYGGGIEIGSSWTTISGCHVFDNRSDLDGGGIHVGSTHDVRLINNDIYSNTAAGGRGGGGVFFYYSDDATLQGNTVFSNTGNNGGGIEIYQSSNPVLEYNVVHHNTGTSVGGIYLSGSQTPTLTHNRVFENSASTSVGGVSLHECPAATLVLNHVCSNTASASIGGIYLL